MNSELWDRKTELADINLQTWEGRSELGDMNVQKTFLYF